MSTKKPNLMAQNSLLTAGKKTNEVDEFFNDIEEEKKEKIITPVIEQEVPEKTEQTPEHVVEHVVEKEVSPPTQHQEEERIPTIPFAKKKEIKKRYQNFYLKESSIELLDRYAGKGKGKTGYNRSELVDMALESLLGGLDKR